MYFISILAVIALTIMVGLSSPMGMSDIASIIDIPSILVLIIITLPMLMASGMFKDFRMGFVLAISKKKEVTLIQLKRSLEAIEYTIKILLYSSIFITAFTFIIICNDFYSMTQSNDIMETFTIFLANMGVGSIVLLYAFGIILLLIPIKSKLKLMMIDFVEKN